MREVINMTIGGIEYSFPKQYLDLLASHGLPINDRFTAKLWTKYLGSFIYNNGTINAKEQKRFFELLNSNSINATKIVVTTSSGAKYNFNEDTQVLSEFTKALQSMQREWQRSKHNKFFASTNNKYAVTTSRLIGFLDYGFSENSKRITPTKLSILAYNLLAMVFPDDFKIDSKFRNEPITDNNNRKTARIKSILKHPKVIKLKE